MTKNKFEKTMKKINAEFKKLRRFCKYIKKVFKFEEIVKVQKDSRNRRNHETSIIFIIVFWGFIFRVRSFNELEQSFQKIIDTLYINKNFKNGTIDGNTVCAIDGTY